MSDAAGVREMARPIDLFLFDLAGTVVRDTGFVLRAFQSAAATVGIDEPDEWYRRRMGVFKKEVFEELLTMHGMDASRSSELVAAFDRAIDEDIRASGIERLGGVDESIAALQDAGVTVGFTTGFGRETARLVIEAAGLPSDLYIGSDEVARGRPHPDLIQEGMRRAGVSDPARVAVAGDTPSDVQAGMAAGCGFVIGVGHGSHTLDEIASAPHTHLLSDLTTLPVVLGLAAEHRA